MFSNWQLLGVAQAGQAAATCAFQSSQTMTIRLGIGASVTPLLLFDALAPCTGTTYGILLRDGAIRPSAGSVSTAAESCTIVGGPLVPASPPKASISGPLRISFCDGIELDASSTTGGGGRSMAFSWDVTIPSIIGTAEVERLRA